MRSCSAAQQQPPHLAKLTAAPWYYTKEMCCRLKRPLVVDAVCSCEVGEHTESSNEKITESEALSPPSQLRILLPLARAGWDQRNKMVNKCNANESEIHNYTREEIWFKRNPH